jgi:hypothetical protein
MKFIHHLKRLVLRGYALALFFVAEVGMAQTSRTPGSDGTEALTNPLQSDTIEGFLNNIVDVLVIFALPIIVFFIMYAGFLFVTARGSEEQIKKARTALLWAVVGGVIVMGAKIISEVIQGTAQAL